MPIDPVTGDPDPESDHMDDMLTDEPDFDHTGWIDRSRMITNQQGELIYAATTQRQQA